MTTSQQKERISYLRQYHRQVLIERDIDNQVVVVIQTRFPKLKPRAYTLDTLGYLTPTESVPVPLIDTLQQKPENNQ